MVSVLTHGSISDPFVLWERFRAKICDDLSHRLQAFTDIPADFENPHFDYGLYLINRDLRRMGKSCTDFALPSPILNWETHQQNPLIRDELDYTPEEEALFRDEKIQRMNEDQRACYDRIITSVETDRTQAHFFLSGPAGTGKTFLYQALCHHFRSKREIFLCVASSGIAALLLPGGRTSHSRFKIPLECTPNGTCNITRQSQLASLLTRASLIIWDEVLMQNKENFAAVKTTLQDICGREDLFGGIPVVLGGDFAQTLPIIPRGNRAAQVK